MAFPSFNRTGNADSFRKRNGTLSGIRAKYTERAYESYPHDARSRHDSELGVKLSLEAASFPMILHRYHQTNIILGTSSSRELSEVVQASVILDQRRLSRDRLQTAISRISTGMCVCRCRTNPTLIIRFYTGVRGVWLRVAVEVMENRARLTS